MVQGCRAVRSVLVSSLVGCVFVALMACPVRAVGAAADGAASRPFLHPLFTDHMVLQRDAKAPVWGWTEPGQKVTVAMSGKRAEAVADGAGKWQAKIGPFAAGGPYVLTVTGPKSVTISDVLVGDVWICSGQSNMEMSVLSSKNAKDEISQANFPQIRLFTVPKLIAFEKRSTVASEWQTCSPTTVGGFSAVGYSFGRSLNQGLNVPIGLIHTSWGGTIAEAWVSPESLMTLADFKGRVEALAGLKAAIDSGQADKLLDKWYEEKDPGTAKAWDKPATDISAWKEVTLPNEFEVVGLRTYDGIAWFQTTFDAPAGWQGKEVVLSLGPIDDFDTTWVNGVKVGGMDRWDAPRSYKLPADVVKPGQNVITIRVLDTGGGGGLVGKPEQLKVALSGDEGSAISLAGPWRMQDSAAWAKIQPAPVTSANNPNISTVLYNGMVAPLVPYAVKGAIWYQGESNAGRALQYRTLLPTLIKDWRKQFGVPNLGFHIVSLANYLATAPQPGDNDWAELREAQALTTKAVPNCGIAMAIDIGEANDIHPKNKQEVGRRLALSAMAVTYGKKIEWSGPWYKAMKVTDKGIRLHFNHAGGGLVSRGGGKLTGFAIAGADHKFVWADAVIQGDTVVVSSPQVAKPVAVRYAWAVNPVCNLYNKAGLPAVPFRTDDWPMITRDAK